MTYWDETRECKCGSDMDFISTGTWWCSYCGRLARVSVYQAVETAPRKTRTMEARLAWYERIMEKYERAGRMITEANVTGRL